MKCTQTIAKTLGLCVLTSGDPVEKLNVEKEWLKCKMQLDDRNYVQEWLFPIRERENKAPNNALV